MNIEENRLNTFRNWPSSAEVEPIRIAKAGFYYTGRGLEVQCFSCNCKISEWNYGDQVMQRHRLLKPDCTFVLNPDLANNVSLVLPLQARSAPNVQVSPTEEIVNYGLTEDVSMFRSNALRLLSFVNWPQNIAVTANLVARAGMYHIGGGRVRCSCCAGVIDGTDLGVDPEGTHARIYPACAQANNFHRGDPLNLSSSDSYESTTPVNSISLTDGALHNEGVLRNQVWRSLGVLSSTERARHPERAPHNARLATFTLWPANRVQTPRELSDAGFYFTGLEDRVRCFYCDGGLGSWEPNDDPWREHARWFPHCAFVLLVKGKEFVNMCKDPSSMNSSAKPCGQPSRPNVFPVIDSEVERIMDSPEVISVLCMGLDAARVRAAVVRRLRNSGVGFYNAETLLDAVIQQQLDEEPWSAHPSEHLRTASLLEGLVTRQTLPMNPSIYAMFTPNDPNASGPPHTLDSSSSPQDISDPPQDISDPLTSPEVEVEPPQEILEPPQNILEPSTSRDVTPINPSKEEKVCEKVNMTPGAREKTLEEENRQLKEARLCKVCMDQEVGVVFLPCGHLVSCASCGTSLAHCPMCRGSIRALVRAYLA